MTELVTADSLPGLIGRAAAALASATTAAEVLDAKDRAAIAYDAAKLAARLEQARNAQNSFTGYTIDVGALAK